MSHFDIDVQCEVAAAASLKDALLKAAESTLEHENVLENSSLTLLLTDDAKLRQLNHDFLGIDKPTDVLSFPSGDSWPGLESYLGDIAISLPTAELQAGTAEHDVGCELTLLAVHGVLHLLGYDHATDEDRNRMSMIQAEILEQLGYEITDPFPTS
jgi:probable rRNA maturation factor